ncbi:hypothetical protein ECBCE011MS01_4233, partial [Escherichia coli BCE011_MS-01]
MPDAARAPYPAYESASGIATLNTPYFSSSLTLLLRYQADKG